MPNPIAQSEETPAPELAPRGSRWQAWLGLAISAVFLAIAFRGQQPAEVWAILRQADLAWLVPALVLFAIGVLVRAVRWSVLLRPVAPLSAREVLPVLLAGYTANNILPLRTGEIVRAFLLGSRFGVRRSAVLGTIAAERLFDGLTMLGFLLAAMTVVSPTPELRRIAVAAALVFALAIAVLAAMLLAGDAWRRRLDLVLRPLPPGLAGRIRSIASAFLEGLGALSRRGDLALVTATSVVAWGFEVAMYWALGRAFGDPLAALLTPAASVLTTAVANLATLVPAAPGYVGTFEAGVRLVVEGALGAPRALTLSYALLVHAALWFPVTVVGAWCWWRIARRASPTTPPRAAPLAPHRPPHHPDLA